MLFTCRNFNTLSRPTTRWIVQFLRSLQISREYVNGVNNLPTDARKLNTLDLLTMGSAPGPRWGLCRQTAVTGLRHRARHEPPLINFASF